jgi:ABC-type thiamine transport system substrate-binding protein
MTNQHKHPVRGLRGIPEDLWTEAEAAAKAANSDRSALIRQFLEWFVGRPEAQLPERSDDGA